MGAFIRSKNVLLAELSEGALIRRNTVSWQTGNRKLRGPKMLPTIWYTYMTLVTKYQISAINSY